MKKLLLAVVLCAGFATAAQSPVIPSTAHLRGEYFGVAFPVASCSNERLVVLITVYDDSYVEGEIADWEGNTVDAFTAAWPFFNRGRFNSNVSGIGTTIRGTVGGTGAMSGTIRLEGGCRYTFKAWRQFRIAQ